MHLGNMPWKTLFINYKWEPESKRYAWECLKRLWIEPTLLIWFYVSYFLHGSTQRGATQYTEKLYEDAVPQDLNSAIVLDICEVWSIISSGVPHYILSVRAGEGFCTVVDWPLFSACLIGMYIETRKVHACFHQTEKWMAWSNGWDSCRGSWEGSREIQDDKE